MLNSNLVHGAPTTYHLEDKTLIDWIGVSVSVVTVVGLTVLLLVIAFVPNLDGASHTVAAESSVAACKHGTSAGGSESRNCAANSQSNRASVTKLASAPSVRHAVGSDTQSAR